MEGQEKVLIFSTSLKAIEMLTLQISENFNFKPLKLIGSMGKEQREAGRLAGFQVASRAQMRLKPFARLGMSHVGLFVTEKQMKSVARQPCSPSRQM